MKNFLPFLLCFWNFGVCAQQWVWAKNAGGIDREEGKSIAVDTRDNIYVTGVFQSSITLFGNITLSNSGAGTDIFLVKYDSIGNVVWVKNAIGSSIDRSESVAIDNDGNIYISGWFSSPLIVFDNDTLINVGGSDVFIVKYDPNGTVVWARSAGGSSADQSTGVVTDHEGAVYLTGFFYSDTAFFGNTVIYNNGSSDIFLSKYDSNGNIQWSKSQGGSALDRAFGITSDKNNNIIISGIFSSTELICGNDTLNAAGSWDNEIFIVKYDSNGNELWAKSPHGSGDDAAWSVCADSQGNIIITGWFYSASLDFDSIILSSSGGSFFIAKYDSIGNSLWAINEGPSGGDTWGYDVSTDNSNNIYVTGQYHSTYINFGSFTLTNSVTGYSGSNGFLAKYDINGNVIWAICPTNNNNVAGYSLAVDESNNLFMTGYFTSTYTSIFSNDTLTGAGELDMFIAKASGIPTGVEESNKTNIVQIFPNPSTGIFTINFLNTTIATKICVYDLLGNCLRSKDCLAENDLKIDLSSQPKGLYFMEIVSDGKRSVNKIVLQ